MLAKILVCVFFVLCNTVSAVFRISISQIGVPSPDLIKIVELSSNFALDHCHKQFKYEKWNCPKNMLLRHSKMPPNKETAFSKAILSASLVYTITKNCSRGEISECSCSLKNIYNSIPENNRKNISWTWGGCSDDTTFANNITRSLFEDQIALNEVTIVGRHNSKVGRQIVKNSMIKKCRCHGVSGSCSLQTCWMQLAPFEEISRKLHEKYKKAQRMTLEKVRMSMAFVNSIKNQKRSIPVGSNNLVYLEESPDYCLPNKSLAWPGTKGRFCSKNTSKSCRNLCRKCGHSVRKIKRKINVRCNCKFTWCCEVKCDTCVETIEDYLCD